MNNVTKEQLAQAFEAWEKDYRVNQSDYKSKEECTFMGVSQLSAERAEYFYALLQSCPARPEAKATADQTMMEIVKLRKALVYVAHALHSTPQHMLAEGIMLVDNNRVWVYYEGLNIGAYENGEPYSYK